MKWNVRMLTLMLWLCVTAIAVKAQNKDMIQGKWVMILEDGKLEFTLKQDWKGEHENRFEHDFQASDFEGYQMGTNVTFYLRKPAGTITFQGKLNQKMAPDPILLLQIWILSTP